MDRVMEENMETNDPERLRVVMRVYMEQQEKKNHNWRRQVSSAKATVAELTRENRNPTETLNFCRNKGQWHCGPT